MHILRKYRQKANKKEFVAEHDVASSDKTFPVSQAHQEEHTTLSHFEQPLEAESSQGACTPAEA